MKHLRNIIVWIVQTVFMTGLVFGLAMIASSYNMTWVGFTVMFVPAVMGFYWYIAYWDQPRCKCMR